MLITHLRHIKAVNKCAPNMVNLCATIIIIYVYLISSEDQFSKSYPKKIVRYIVVSYF